MPGHEDDGIPLVQHSHPSKPLGRPGHTDGVSNLSPPRSPTLQAYIPYRPQLQNPSAGLSSKPTSSTEPLISRESISVSHVPLTLPSASLHARVPYPISTESSNERPPQLDSPACGSGSLPRSGPSNSPSTKFGERRLSLPLSAHDDSLSPIARAASVVGRGIAGRLRSIRAGGHKKHESIPEGDEMEEGLVDAASHFGSRGTAYNVIRDSNDDDAIDYRSVDLTSFGGSLMTPRDDPALLQYRELESSGQLTGGLGTGDIVDATISSKDLMKSATSLHSPTLLPRSISRRQSRVARKPTLRDLAQAEADRRGQIIEVIVEESADSAPESSTASTRARGISESSVDTGIEESTAVDLTSYGGGSTLRGEFDASAKSHISMFARRTNSTRVETFYPTANWKPFSMQWPYLTFLIVISIVVCVAQEYLYRRSNSNLKKDPPEGLYTFQSPEDVKTWDYFCFKYLPTMLAVTYGVLWQLTDSEVKRLEPYYQLSKPKGALAAESINIDYITIFSFWRPITALRLGHWAVAVSSLASLLAVSIIPILQSASITLEPDLETRLADPNGTKRIVIVAGWSRLLSVSLATTAALGCCLLVQLQRRNSGLVADVKGIAGIAAMATKSFILMDFRDLDTVPPKEIHKKLKNHRYTLRHSSLAPDDNNPVSRKDMDKYDDFKVSQNPHPLMLRLVAGIPLISSMALFMMFVPIVLFTKASVLNDKAPWLFTLISVSIKLAYQTLEQDLRMMEPFYILWCRHASPKVLTLDYTRMAFGYMPIMAAINMDFLMAFVGLGSVLAEILTVCVASFAGVVGDDFLPASDRGSNKDASDKLAESGEETPVSFWVSFVLTTGILVYLITTASLAYLWRRHPFLPRQPSTIASVLAFVHQSKMLYDFASKAKGEDNDSMVQRLIEARKTYGLGWFTGRDGETHCGVDEEELRGSYKHQQAGDFRLATKPWLSNWETY